MVRVTTHQEPDCRLHACALVPQSYSEAIKIAEEREKKVRHEFDKYDLDDSGTIDIDELMCLLDDLGLLTKLKTERVNFTTEMFEKYDSNEDGVLRCAAGRLQTVGGGGSHPLCRSTQL